ncbi:MAG: hypothetical protein QM811_06960 [Pirellulales bacterium]
MDFNDGIWNPAAPSYPIWQSILHPQDGQTASQTDIPDGVGWAMLVGIVIALAICAFTLVKEDRK